MTKVNAAKLLIQDKNLYNIFIKNYNILKEYKNIIIHEREKIHLRYSMFNKITQQFELKNINNLGKLINELNLFMDQEKNITIYTYPLRYIKKDISQDIVEKLDFMIKKD